jgi:hypothetical protein
VGVDAREEIVGPQQRDLAGLEIVEPDQRQSEQSEEDREGKRDGDVQRVSLRGRLGRGLHRVRLHHLAGNVSGPRPGSR